MGTVFFSSSDPPGPKEGDSDVLESVGRVRKNPGRRVSPSSLRQSMDRVSVGSRRMGTVFFQPRSTRPKKKGTVTFSRAPAGCGRTPEEDCPHLPFGKAWIGFRLGAAGWGQCFSSLDPPGPKEGDSDVLESAGRVRKNPGRRLSPSSLRQSMDRVSVGGRRMGTLFFQHRSKRPKKKGTVTFSRAPAGCGRTPEEDCPHLPFGKAGFGFRFGAVHFDDVEPTPSEAKEYSNERLRGAVGGSGE